MIIPISTWNSKASQFLMDGNGDLQSLFDGKDLVHHPIETTIYKWLF